MKKITIILLLISNFAIAQTELLPVISWQTNVSNVEQLTDSTYRFSVFPLDWNEPGAAAIQYGRYFQDYAGNTYEVIDSAYLSVTVKDVFDFGVSPQVNQVGIMFEPPTDADYLAPIQYQKLDKIGLDNARARELAYIWQTMAKEDELPDWATAVESQTGVDTTKMMNPKRTAEQITLNQMPYFGALENLYSDYNLQGDTGVFNNLKLLDGYNVGYYLKVDEGGVIIAEAISGALVYKGTWSASTNTPTLADGTGTNGWYYRVIEDGTVDFGSGNISFLQGDDVIYNGATWEKIPNLGFVLQPATASVLGGVKIGDNVDVDVHGVISVDLSDLAGKDTLAYYVLLSDYNSRDEEVSDSLTNHEGRIITLETDLQTTTDSLDYYVLKSVYEARVQALSDSLGIAYDRTAEQSDSLIQLYGISYAQSDSLLELYGISAQQADSILTLYNFSYQQSDSIIANADSIDALALLIADLETVAQIATAVEAQTGISELLMSVERVREQIELNAVKYWNVREDIYSDYNITADSIFANNLYQETISANATGTAGVYTKEVETNDIEVYVNGVLQAETVQYTQTATEITLLIIPLVTDIITIKYK